MQAIAMFTRSHLNEGKNRKFILPVLVDITECPMGEDFDAYDYNGRAWQAMVDAGETDPNGIVPDDCSSPSLEYITTYTETIPLNKWVEIDPAVHSRLIRKHMEHLYTKASFLQETETNVPESIGYELTRVEDSHKIDLLITCSRVSISDIKSLGYAVERYNSFLCGERYSISKKASVLLEYTQQLFGGLK